MSVPKLICVTYTDNMSAGHLSINDLFISYKEQIFAANSTRLKYFTKGDYVIICATQNKEKLFFVAKIVSVVHHPLTEWSRQGGELWKYNFNIEPITEITHLTERRKNQIQTILNSMRLNPNNLLHPRFCSEKLMTGLDTLLRLGVFPSPF